MDFFFLLSAFIAFMLTVQTTLSDDLSSVKKCRGVDIDLTEDHFMHMNECLKEAGAKDVPDLAPDKMPCFGKCVFVKKGMIDENGIPHKEKIMGMIIDYLPKEVHDDLNKKISACLSAEATASIDKDDESCVTYIPILMCIHISFMEECEA